MSPSAQKPSQSQQNKASVIFLTLKRFLTAGLARAKTDQSNFLLSRQTPMLKVSNVIFLTSNRFLPAEPRLNINCGQGCQFPPISCQEVAIAESAKTCSKSVKQR